jgi:hypothetical protein
MIWNSISVTDKEKKKKRKVLIVKTHLMTLQISTKNICLMLKKIKNSKENESLNK